MIKEINLNGVDVVWNDYFSPNILEEEFVIYCINFFSGEKYIGKTKRRLYDRINEHTKVNDECSKLMNEDGRVFLSILAHASDEDELGDLEKYYIHKALIDNGIDVTPNIDKSLVKDFLINNKLYL